MSEAVCGTLPFLFIERFSVKLKHMPHSNGKDGLTRSGRCFLTTDQNLSQNRVSATFLPIRIGTLVQHQQNAFADFIEGNVVCDL